MNVYINIYQKKGEVLVAACDEELLGKTFKEGRLKLEVKEAFYKGSLKELSDAVRLISNSDVANLVGRRIVGAVVEEGIADSRAVISIAGVPHLQIMRM